MTAPLAAFDGTTAAFVVGGYRRFAVSLRVLLYPDVHREVWPSSTGSEVASPRLRSSPMVVAEGYSALAVVGLRWSGWAPQRLNPPSEERSCRSRVTVESGAQPRHLSLDPPVG